MYYVLQQDLQSIDEILSDAKSFALTHLQNLAEIPVTKNYRPATLPSLPAAGVGTRQVQQLFNQQFYQHIIASPGSRYWGFVTGGTTPAAIAGDWLTTVFDQNPQATTGLADVAALLEVHAVNLLLQLFGLPGQEFAGGMVSGATMSNFTGLAAGRQWLGKQQDIDIARGGIKENLLVYTATPHSSAIKALAMLGMGSSNVQFVETLPGRECINIELLEEIIKANGAAPFILISSGGTVNTVDYDDLKAIAALKKKYNFWWHIDAAFGAFAALSPNHAHLLNGWELADSITVDCHKWLNVPYDSAVIFVRKQHAALQMESFQNSNAPYLGDPMTQFNYLNFLPENSRRFRALPIWFTLMAYGKDGYREIVERNIAEAKELGSKIAALKGFELAAPVRLNTVCFTVNDENKKEVIDRILQSLATRGRLFITPTVYKGIHCLRAALVNWRTMPEDIDIAIEELKTVYEETKK